MPFTDAHPVPGPAPAGTGITFSYTVSKRGVKKARITVRADRQVQLFGEPIDGKRFHIQIGRGADEGRLRIVKTSDGEFVGKAGIKGSASISFGGWDLLPKDKRPAASCEVHATPSNVEVILRLPSWCRPSGAGGKMEQEFGLGRAKGGKA